MGGRNAGRRGDRARSPVVSDSSPLIALDRIGRLDLLREVFEQVLVPPAVVGELGPLWPQAWSLLRRLSRPIDARVLRVRLDPGEREAVALASEVGARQVVLDDLPARRLAQSLGLPTIGTGRVLLTAKQLGLLSAVRPSLDALLATGFYVGPTLQRRALTDAGEWS